MKLKYLAPFLILIISLCAGNLAAQGIVSGKIYESTSQLPLEGVSVRNKNTGSGELSDRFGFYSVNAKTGDSVEIYILGYKRFRFRVSESSADLVKNIYLTIEKFNLPEVEVMARRNATKDSANNRREYAALFDYRRRSVGKAILGSVFNPISSLQSLTEIGKNRRLKHFQVHLVAEEKENYISSRFSRQDVEEITGLKGKELEDFMFSYRPGYEFTQNAKEYDMLVYIKAKFDEYTASKAKNPGGSIMPGAKAVPASNSAPAAASSVPGAKAVPASNSAPAAASSLPGAKTVPAGK